MRTPIAMGTALGGAGVAAWAGWQLFKGYGRLLLAQDELRGTIADLERRLAAVERGTAALPVLPAATAAARGLAVGAAAPEFALPGLDGQERRLADYRGRPLLIVFFNTGCGFCARMAPRLGEIDPAGPRVLLVGAGDADAYRRLAAEHSWRCDVVLDPAGATMRAYLATGTPMAYLLDAQGRVAAPRGDGADAALALLTQPPSTTGSDDPAADPAAGSPPRDLTAASLREKEAIAQDRARAAGLAVRESTLNRQGLAAGAVAPDFRLPDLDGREHALADYRGRRVLLVFSAPDCGPCQTLAPRLVSLAREQPDLQIVLVSRGEREENAAKAAEHQFPFPVLLQPGWQVSRLYAMFATPVAYLINEQGVLASDVAVGGDAILQLAQTPALR